MQILFFLGADYAPFGTGRTATASSGSGDAFGLAFCGGAVTDTCVTLPDNYASNDPLAFSAQFEGQSFASLGITVTDPISLAFDSNEVNLSFSLQTAVVPLPASLPLLGFTLLGLGALVRKAKTGARHGKAV